VSAQTIPAQSVGSGAWLEPIRGDGAPHAESEGVGGLRKFEAEGVTLILGDCRDAMPIEADAVVSDPPYGMKWNTDSTRFTGGQAQNNRSKKRGDGRSDYGEIAHDDEPFDPSPWLQYPRVVLFGANHFGARLPVGTTLIWVKKDEHLWGTFLSDAEVAWMKGGHGVYLRRKNFTAATRAIDHGGNPGCAVGIHPTQKPVAIMTWCMERAKVPVGATVLDPYMGSGTTGIACIRTGRKFIGIEKDPAHFETACRRIRAELAQGVLPLGGGGGFLPLTPSPEQPRLGSNAKAQAGDGREGHSTR